MLGGLVFLLLPLGALVFWSRSAARDWRASYVWASLAWAGGISVATELLGAGHLIRFWPVLILCLGGNLVLALLLFRAWQGTGGLGWPVLGSPFVRIMAVILGALLGLGLVAAVFSSPNTLDVLTYHLPRQLHWLQQGSMAHFLTDDDRELMMPPLTEIIQMNAMLLAGGDGWAAFTQWLSYGLGLVAVSLLVREFGGGVRAQWLGAVIFGTVPMAYHEASSAKNDLMAAVWLGVLAWIILRLVREEGVNTMTWIAAGVALGLACATKSTAFLFAPPIMMVAIKAGWRHPRRAALLAVAALVLAGPYLWRNQSWYGTPLGIHRAEDGGAQATETRTWRSVTSNLLRNATLHLGAPPPEWNAHLASAVARFHAVLGLDENDRRTTLWVSRYDVLWAPEIETRAGAPALGLLGFGAGVWLLVRARRGPERAVLGMVVGGVLLFCLLLKWQPWGARLHLPVFLLLAALAARFAEQLGPRAMAVFAGLCFVGWLPAAENQDRPLWSSPTIFSLTRWEGYFPDDPKERALSDAVLVALREAGAKSLEVHSKHSPVYPIMKGFLAQNGPQAVLWSELPGALAASADAVLIRGQFAGPMPLHLRPPGSRERYRAAGETEPYGLYLPESRARALAATLPLPNFVGWETAPGFGAPEILRHGEQRIAVRHMEGSSASLTFRRTAPAMSLRLKVFNPATAPCVLRLQLDGRQIATLRFEVGNDFQVVQVPFEPAAEQGQLSLTAKPGSGDATKLVFFAVQVDD